MATKQKKNQLEQYLKKTHSEINDKAVSSLKGITTETDIVAIDEDLKPILVVLSSDILNNSHQTAIDNAALLKLSVLGIKAYNAGQIQFPQNMDIGSLPTVLQSVATLVPSLTGCVGSLIECMGKNIKQQTNDTIFQYGLAAHIGASNSPKSITLQEIGIQIGNLDNNINKEASYQKFKELVKSLPNNKYRKRLIELADKLYKEGKEERTVNKETIKKEDKEDSKTEVKFNVSKE